MAIDVGATYRTTLSVYDENGSLTNPSTKVLTVTEPDQTTSQPSVSTSGTGLFYVDVDIDAEGLWKFQWVTTGPNTAKTDYESAVEYRAVLGLDDMRAYLGLSGTTKDEILRELMMAATVMAEKIAGTCIPRTFTDEPVYGVTNRLYLRLPHGPIFDEDSVTSISSQTSGGPSWSASDLIVYPNVSVVALASGDAFWYGPWKATYVAGRTIVPQRIIMAVKLIVYDLFANQRGVLADPLSPNYEDQAEYEFRIPPGYEMPAQAFNLLMREKRPGFA